MANSREASLKVLEEKVVRAKRLTTEKLDNAKLKYNDILQRYAAKKNEIQQATTTLGLGTYTEMAKKYNACRALLINCRELQIELDQLIFRAKVDIDMANRIGDAYKKSEVGAKELVKEIAESKQTCTLAEPFLASYQKASELFASYPQSANLLIEQMTTYSKQTMNPFLLKINAGLEKVKLLIESKAPSEDKAKVQAEEEIAKRQAEQRTKKLAEDAEKEAKKLAEDAEKEAKKLTEEEEKAKQARSSYSLSFLQKPADSTVINAGELSPPPKSHSITKSSA